VLRSRRVGQLDLIGPSWVTSCEAAKFRRSAAGRLPGWARDLADTHDLVQEQGFATGFSVKLAEAVQRNPSRRRILVGDGEGLIATP
jgi:hypothetical protein